MPKVTLGEVRAGRRHWYRLILEPRLGYQDMQYLWGERHCSFKEIACILMICLAYTIRLSTDQTMPPSGHPPCVSDTFPAPFPCPIFCSGPETLGKRTERVATCLGVLQEFGNFGLVASVEDVLSLNLGLNSRSLILGLGTDKRKLSRGT